MGLTAVPEFQKRLNRTVQQEKKEMKRMKMGKKGISVVVLAIIGSILGAASLAWACSQAAGFSALTQAGPVGTTFVATATGYSGPVEIRWNSADGPVVSTPIRAGAFSVTVPDVSPGVYYLVFATKDAGVGRMAFDVTPSAGAAGSSSKAPADLWSGFASGSKALSADAPAVDSRPGNTAAGLGLFGAGLLMTAGVSVIALRRSRARAS